MVDEFMSNRFLKAYKWLCLEIVGLIAVGASVRAMDAGLACPDWPLCFGQYIPDYHPQVYFEFIHRVLAGTAGLLIVGFNVYLLRSSKVGSTVKFLCGLSLLLLALQIIMGGLTVLLQLHDKIVALHLLLAMSLLTTLTLIYFSISSSIRLEAPCSNSERIIVSTIVIAVVGQITLGALVASNYAGLACTGFPLCNGQWIPTLAGPVGLQVLHRFFAYGLLILVTFYFMFSKLSSVDSLMKVWIQRLTLLIYLQAVVGIANVLLFAPALITVLHSTVAALILVSTVRIGMLAFMPSWPSSADSCRQIYQNRSDGRRPSEVCHGR